MRHHSLPLVFLATFAIAARAEDAIPPEVVAAIKDATVYVKIKAEGLSGSGSGFVVKTEGDSVYVVTNDHVVEPKTETVTVEPKKRPSVPRTREYFPTLPRQPYHTQVPPPIIVLPSTAPRVVVRHYANAAVTVVFRSGTKKEQSIAAEVLAADPELDLAVVKVSGVKDVPRPIDCQHEPKLTETMPIYIVGFPLGNELAMSKGNPAITVGKGSVSSLRLDDEGRLAVVQIDGAINHGNSGGPIVDVQGRLVGIAVAFMKHGSSIGLAIPSHKLTEVLAGRIGKVSLHSFQQPSGVVTVYVDACVVDPMNKIKSAELHYLAANKVKSKPKATKPLEPLPGCRKLPLTIENRLATGEFTLKRGVTEVSLLYQAVYVNGAGEHVFKKSVAATIKPNAVEIVAEPDDATGKPAEEAPDRKDDGREFTSRNGMFTITMPAGRKWVEQSRVLAIRSHRIPAEGAECILANGTSYTAGSIGMPAVVMRDVPALGRLDLIRDAIVQQLKGKLVKEATIHEKSMPGKRFQVKGPDSVARVQMYMIGGWAFYAIVEGKTKEDASSEEAESFCGSIRLTEKGKSAAEKILHPR